MGQQRLENLYAVAKSLGSQAYQVPPFGAKRLYLRFFVAARQGFHPFLCTGAGPRLRVLGFDLKCCQPMGQVVQLGRLECGDLVDQLETS
jgi:hypothetical protein